VLQSDRRSSAGKVVVAKHLTGTSVTFANVPGLVYLCRQLLEASRFGHFVLRSLQDGSTEANAATVTQNRF
jgi:hypothetical protein